MSADRTRAGQGKAPPPTSQQAAEESSRVDSTHRSPDWCAASVAGHHGDGRLVVDETQVELD
jgi:hypothetical protein